MIELIRQSTDQVYSQIDSRSIADWAKDYIYLQDGKFQDPGEFDAGKSPYFLEILESLQDYSTHTMIVQKAVKLGGTLYCGDIFLPWVIMNRPGNFLFIFNSNETAKQHLRARIRPILLGSKNTRLKNYLPKFARNISDDGFDLPTMNVVFSGCAESRLQNKDCQYVVCDEVYTWANGMIDEAESRTIKFRQKGMSKFVLISQGGLVADNQDFWKRTESGTKEIWSVYCLGCNKPMIPNWDHMKFDVVKGENNEYLWKQIYPTIHYLCPHCNHKHFDTPEVKEAWSKPRCGEYIVTNPNAMEGVRSFIIPGLCTNVYTFGQLVSEFLLAKEEFNVTTNPDKLRVFFQKRMAENVDVERLYDQRDQMKFYDYTVSDNPDAVYRASFVDIQGGKDSQNIFYWNLILDFSKDGDSWLLWFGKHLTDESLIKKHEEFKITPENVFVDVGFRMNTHSLPWIAQYNFNGVRGCGGPDDEKKLYWTDKITKQRSRDYFSDWQHFPTGIVRDGKQLIGYYVYLDVNLIKDILDNVRKGNTPIKMHRPKDNKLYMDQMDSEYPQKQVYGGRTYRKWVCKRNRDNHAWDLETIALGVAIMHSKHTDKINVLDRVFPSRINQTAD